MLPVPVSYEDFRVKLKAAGLKATPQRIVVLEALCISTNHPSAENIFETIRLKHPGISLGTVYKTLDSFVAAGLAEKVLSTDGNFRYDWNTCYHNHIYCTNTREIVDYVDDELQQIIENYFTKKTVSNLKIKDIRLQINAEKIDPEKEINIY